MSGDFQEVVEAAAASVLDVLDQLPPESLRMIESVLQATPDELAASADSVSARAHRLELLADDHAWYAERGIVERALASFSAVLMRKDPPFDVEFLNATLLLSRAVELVPRIRRARRWPSPAAGPADTCSPALRSARSCGAWVGT